MLPVGTLLGSGRRATPAAPILFSFVTRRRGLILAPKRASRVLIVKDVNPVKSPVKAVTSNRSKAHVNPVTQKPPRDVNPACRRVADSTTETKRGNVRGSLIGASAP